MCNNKDNNVTVNFVRANFNFEDAPKDSPFLGITDATTHNGVFHGDDVLGAALLRLANPGLVVHRTRNKENFKGVVFDVGLGEYDHHGPRKEVGPDGVPYCGVSRMWTAGLNRVFFPGDGQVDRTAEDLFYKQVLVPVAYQDNGETAPQGVVNLFEWVHWWNPAWNGDKSPEAFDARFEIAVKQAMKQLMFCFEAAWAEARAQEVLGSLDTQLEVIKIPAGLPGWQNVLGVPESKAKFVLFEGTPDTPFYVQAVPDIERGMFSQRVPFPEEWRGKSPEALEELGIHDAVFCHAGGFIAGFKTEYAAMMAADKALEWTFGVD